MRLQQTINEQNLSKPERLGSSVPPCSGQRACKGEEIEPTSDASESGWSLPIGTGQVGYGLWLYLVKRWSWLMILGPGRLVRAVALRIELRTPRAGVRTGYSRLLKQAMEGAWNLGTSVWLPPLVGMIKTADDRRAEGRSLRSSLNAGKPHTGPRNGRRREAVDAISFQEVDKCPAW